MSVLWLIFLLIHSKTSAEYFDEPLTRSRRAAIPVNGISWPNGRIPYIIDRKYFKPDELQDLQTAINVWNSETCVHFSPYRSGDKSWVRIIDGRSCFSEYTGYKGTPGEQFLRLSKNGCRFYGLYLHELGHVIGLDHEHIRADRDEFLKVDTSGVPDNLKSFFTKKTKNQLLTYDSPYDLQSIMHYGQSSFSVFADKTPIDVKDAKLRPLLKDVYIKDVSFWDVRAVNLEYNCKDRCRGHKPKCEAPGFIDKNCKCQTPEGFAKRRCVDNHGTTKCLKMAEKLECYRNASFMTVNCRKTCGFCYADKLSNMQKAPVIACKDHHEYCKGWAREGQCEKAASYMEMMCPESCGYCNKTKNDTTSSSSSPKTGSVEPVRLENNTCTDRYRYPADCEAWAKEGKCELNKIWMHFNCAKSCGVCGTSSTAKQIKVTPAPKTTTTTTAKTTRKATKPTTTTTAKPIITTRKPATPPCKDLYGTRNCESLASRNMCKSHKSWMMRQCPLTCGFCQSDSTTTTKKIPERTTTTQKSKMATTTTTTMKTTTTTTTSKPNVINKKMTEVKNTTAGYLEYCKIGDPPNECPKSRASCRSIEIYRKCPNICKNCGPCQDASKSCAAFKRSGYCKYYPASTIPICRKTCGACSS